jgi:integrase
MSRTKGTGAVYLRGKVWWISLEREGRIVFRESTHSELKTAAVEKLKQRVHEIESGFVSSRKLTVSETIERVFDDYESEGYRSLQDAKERWAKHLKPVLGSVLARNVNTKALRKYRDARLEAGAAKATVNRELALLRRGFHIARQDGQLQFIPAFPMLSENGNARDGWLEDAQYDKLAAACAKRGLWLRAMFETAYQLGWRSGELIGLRVKQFDPHSRTLRLRIGSTKNKEGREAVCPQRLFLLLQQCALGKKPDDLLFTRDRQQRSVRDFRAAWFEATKEAGLAPKDEKTKRPGLLFHDLRRTAVRNMVRRGISEKVAMTISGHKTRSVFDRYHIVADSDLREAALKMEQPIRKTTDELQFEVAENYAQPN